MSMRTVVCCAASVAGAIAISGALFAGDALAKDFPVKVAIPVSTQGIDLQQPGGAEKLYGRIEHAAQVACTYGNRVDLKPASNLVACREAALGDAIRSVNSPLLTKVYLQSHTTRQAAARGIQLPDQVASK